MSVRVLTARRWVRPLVWGLLLASGLSAWYLFRTYPAWIHRRAEAALSERLGRASHISEVRLDPLSLVAEVRGLRIPGPAADTPLLDVARIEVQLAGEGLFRGPLRILRAEVEDPVLSLTRRPDGTWDGEEILRRLTEGEGPAAPFVLESLAVRGGEVRVHDAASGRSAELKGIALWLPGLSTLPEDAGEPVTFRLACEFLGGHLRASGSWAAGTVTPAAQADFLFEDLATQRVAEALDLPLPGGLAPATLAGSLHAKVTAPESLPATVVFETDLAAVSRGRSAEPTEMQLRAEGGWQPSAGVLDARIEATLRGLSLPAVNGAFPRLLGSLRTRGGTVDARAEGRWALRPGEAPQLALAGTARLRDLSVSEDAGRPFFLCPHAEVRLGPCEPLEGRYRVEGVDLEGLRLRAEADPVAQGGRLLRASGWADASGGAGPSLAMGPVRVRGGQIDFEGIPPQDPLPQDFRDVALSLTPPPGDGGPWGIDAQARFHEGALIEVRGTLAGPRGPAELDLAVRGLGLGHVGSWFPPELATHLDGAEADAGGLVRWEPGAGGSGLHLGGGYLTVRSLRLRSLSGSEVFDIPEIRVKGIEADLDRRVVTCDDIWAEAGRLRLQRDAEGALNLPVPPSPSGDAGRLPWTMRAKRALFRDWTMRLEDWSLQEPAEVEVSRAVLALEDLSTEEGAEVAFRLEATLEEGGEASLSGKVRPGPLGIESHLALRDVPLALLQPYVAERLEVVVQEGLLSCDGALATPPRGAGDPVPPSFRGELLVSGFRAVERERWEDLLAWDTLHLGGVSLSASPPSASVEEAALSDFYARAQIRPDATLNLFHLWKPTPPEAARSGSDAASGAGFRLDGVALQNGTVDFSDRFIQPNYSASLRGVTGRLTGFDSSGGTAAEIELRGRLGDGAPFEVVGLANPFKKDLFADIRASCRNVDLVPFSSYAGKYTGFSIAGGKMHLEVTYHMEDRRMEAKSRVLLDQFALGEKVSGSGAPDLPLKLAVALLKDRSGQILLEVPLTGSVEALQVDLKPLVGKMFRGAVAKALTSPFRWVARLFRREPEVFLVPFEPGRSELGPGAGDVLARVAERLSRSGGAKVSVAGLFEPRVDEEGLKLETLRRRVASEGAAGGMRASDASSPGRAPLAPEEYARRLEVLYRRQDFPKPRDADGRPKALPVAEMEKLLLAYTEVGLGELRRLANDRADAVRGALLALGAPQERIYIADPDALPPAAREGLRTRAALAVR